ncbi:MAG: succinylglutamate desuccinylase/aspartoacylase family protein [Gammaproteobacteria bacterium]|nr:succinylglutamate desuccinylase/aspartoacylase family protein [Gammaproteobacteria bacterium]
MRGLVLALGCTAAVSCQPPGEQARAATTNYLTPMVTAVPVINPRVTVLPAPQPAPAPATAEVAATAQTEQPETTETAQADAPAADTAEPGAQAAAAPATDNDETIPEDILPANFEMLGEMVAPGTFARLTWIPTETFTGNNIPSAVLVAHGSEPGPTMCLTAAIHGDELNGIETVRRVLHEVEPERLVGTLIGVPIVNLQGFHRNSRYLPDRRDLNRFFPGNPTGSAASRIAHSLFNEVVRHCDWLVDLHTGSFHRTNLPQLRADLNNEQVVQLTQGFGSTVILHSDGASGTLRRAAADAGIPAVTLEAGMPLQVQEDAVNHSVKGIFTLLDSVGMYNKRSLWGNPEPIYYQSRWVRSDNGGILAGEVRLGRRVQEGDVLGTVIDPISNEQNTIISPYHGRVIGMALDQFVMPGYATFHIGIESEVAQAKQSESAEDVDHATEDYESVLEEGD